MSIMSLGRGNGSGNGNNANRVEPTLQQSYHMGAGVALHANGFLIDPTKLALQDVAVVAAKLLLCAQLNAVV